MKKGTKKLKTYEQFQPEEVAVVIDKERLQNLINMATPLLDEISRIIEQDEDRTISIEMYNDIISTIDNLEQIKKMY